MGVLVEVVIGLTLTYLIISLICTVINEFFASVLKLRAAGLQKGIEEIIDDDQLKQAFLQAGIIKMAGRASGKKGPSYMPSRTFALGLLDALDPKKPVSSHRTAKSIAAAINKLPKSLIKDTLSTLARDAGENVDAVRDSIAEWFDQMMDRATGVYRRNMQTLSLVFAVVLCVALNVDSVQIGRALWFDPELRQAIGEAASELVVDTGNVDDLADLAVIGENLRPLPIGWDFSGPGWSGDWFRSPGGWFLKILGIAFSALAVSLGAPFWFDLLSKFVAIRAAGKEPTERKPKAGTLPAGSEA